MNLIILSILFISFLECSLNNNLFITIPELSTQTDYTEFDSSYASPKPNYASPKFSYASPDASPKSEKTPHDIELELFWNFIENEALYENPVDLTESKQRKVEFKEAVDTQNFKLVTQMIENEYPSDYQAICELLQQVNNNNVERKDTQNQRENTL